MTMCPHHREIYGFRWRSGKVRCCVPIEAKGYRGLNSRESLFIVVTLGELAFCWNCILFNLGLIYTIWLCCIRKAYDKLTTGLRHRKRVVGLICKKQFISQACRKLVVSDKVVPCKSAFNNGKSLQVSATIYRFLSAQPGFALLAALSSIGQLLKTLEVKYKETNVYVINILCFKMKC